MASISEQFWDQVAERAAPDEYTVGQVVLLEDESTKTQHYKVVSETWIDGNGSHMARLRDATKAELEVAVPPFLIILVPSSEEQQ